MTTVDQQSLADRSLDLAGAADFVLAAAALNPIRRFRPGAETVQLVRRLGRRPRKLTLRASDLVKEFTKIAIGTSTVAPEKGDRRFGDPAWSGNPLLHRLVQAYLATAQTTQVLVTDAHLDWRHDHRARFLIDNLMDAAAPSNNPVVNPVAWKALIDTGGTSAVRGAYKFVRDMASAPRIPQMVEPSAFEVGGNVAVTPGSVVLRTPMFELIQYSAQTEQVRSVPLLIVPPVINKYYVIDMAPGRSLIEYLVSEGQQVFVLSWRNPDARHRSWGLDAYGQAILKAVDAVAQICDVDRAHLLGLCSGGIIASMVAAHMADTAGHGRLASLSLGVTVLDQDRAGASAALIDESTARLAVAASSRRGYLDGRNLAEMFAWLRPNDLVWNYWVNNYLQGRPPPPFDVLYWNADTTRMAAHLHRDFIDLGLSNALTRPGEASMLGSGVDLAKIDVDAYVVAGVADHISPWPSCYATTQLLGGQTRFVLSAAGHIAALVNPPSNPKSTYQTNDENPPDPDAWLRSATAHQGSWWPDYSRWLGERSGSDKDAPSACGGRNFPPQEPAPGTYVFDR
jgi:polyhydroxyalkanoate synthase